jgi:signal transduction histidine kinase
MLQRVPPASQNGVLVYHAVRNAGGIIVDLRLAMLNAVAERDFDKPATDLLGQLYSRLFADRAEADLLERYRQVIITGESARFDIQHPLPGQAATDWFEVSVVPMQDGVIVSYDTTTQAKANAARLPSVLQQAFDSAIGGFTVYEAVYDASGKIDDFRFVMINDTGLRMSGYTREELIGKALWEIYPATGITGLFNQYVQVCETGEPLSGEKYYPEYDIWRDYTIVRVAGGVMISYTDSTTRKKLEETARQQAQMLTGILEAVPVGIVVLQAVRNRQKPDSPIVNFSMVQANPAFQTAFGLGPAAVAGQLLTELLPQSQESGLLSRCIMATEMNHLHQFEMPNGAKEATRWYQVSMKPDDDQLILSLTDITEARQLQVTHHFQAELLRSVSDNIPASVVLWEAVRDDTPQRNVIDFRYRMSNRINTYLTGFSEKQLLGHDLLVTFPRFRGTELETALRDALQTTRTQHMLFTYYTEQQDRWFDAQFSRLGSGPADDHVLMTLIDVTEQHKVQLIQKQQAELFETVINAQPAGLVLFAPVRDQTADGQPGPIVDFTYVLANETQLQVTGLSLHNMIGQRQRTLFPGPDGHRFFEQLVEVAETGEPQEWLLTASDNGINGWFQSSLIRQGDQVLFTFLDVSELKRQQQALEVANLNLRRSNENLQRFAYIASHDLQEPLRKIQSFGDILASTYQHVLDEPGQDMIRRMQTSATRMSMLIRDLLAYSRLSTHRVPYNQVALADVVRQVLSDLELRLTETGAVVELGELPVVTGDRPQLEQLLLNLLTNALKFRRPGVASHVRIDSRQLPATAVPFGVLPVEANSRDYVEISVSDNGIGFDEKYLDRIFQVFQRLHGKADYAGSGVGLAICRKVVENHDGGITATSTPGIGSSFKVYLPTIN